MEHTVGITIPIFWGQGAVTPIGFLPKRSPINTVVGAPIVVPRYSGNLPQLTAQLNKTWLHCSVLQSCEL